MNLLLDTHTFIWYNEGSVELSHDARQEIENPQNQCFVSIASLWEMSIKIGLGKLDIQSPFETVLDDVSENGFELLPVTFEHTFQNSRLDWYHKDPFDRLLVAQCLVEKISIISRDSILDLYFGNALVKRIW
ncbi:MAG: type II toxin-antitoxin system VapC family toxin [Saprospiraceae bacterium]|jgi:PIN domain nuclease of toxin-antitoxin system|nr:type II toxin-antitoxin system VapC family toxin [Saprospiraceae bacterium]